MIKRTCILFFFITFCFSQNSIGDTQIKKLLTLSIEELMNLKVTTSSKEETTIKEAPGIISVVTAEEISEFGGESLFEIINRMPNTISHIGHSFDVVAIRGGDLTIFSGKVSYLLNGHPIRNNASNGNYYNFLHSFPISRIKQIEMVRGPGSVIHGNNAFDGVINIITYDKKENISANLLFGTYGTKTIDLNIGKRINGVMLNSAFSKRETNGASLFSRDRENDSTGVLGSFNMPMAEENKSVNSSVEYKGFKFSHHYSLSDHFINLVYHNSFLLTYSEPDENHTQLNYTSETSIYTLDFKHKFSDQLNIKLSYNSVKEEFKWQLGAFTAIVVEGYSKLFESIVKYNPTENASILLGFKYKNLKSNNNSIVQNGFDFDYLAYFSELHYSISKKLISYVGFQFNKPIGYSGAFVPRLSLGYKIASNYYTKYSIARAFRSPDPSQYLLDNIVTINGNTIYLDKGNPNLNSEFVTTHDIQFIYSDENTNLSIGFFHSSVEDMIQSRPESFIIEGDTVEYLHFRDNFGSLKNYGVEFEAKLKLSESLFITNSFNYNLNTYNSNVENHTLAPNYQYKVGINYGKPKYTISTFLIASDAYNTIEGTRNEASNVVDINPDPNSFYNLTAHLKLNLNEFIKDSKFPEAILSLYIRNVLDYHQYQPEIYSLRLKSIPGMLGRNFNLKLNVTF